MNLDGLYVRTRLNMKRFTCAFAALVLFVVFGGKLVWNSWELVFGAGSFIVAVPMLAMMAITHFDAWVCIMSFSSLSHSLSSFWARWIQWTSNHTWLYWWMQEARGWPDLDSSAAFNDRKTQATAFLQATTTLQKCYSFGVALESSTFSKKSLLSAYRYIYPLHVYQVGLTTTKRAKWKERITVARRVGSKIIETSR